MPHATDPALRDALVGVVGADAVITDPGRLVVYESDAMTRWRGRPDGVVLPRTTEEVASVVRILGERGIPMVARGAGTGLSGGAVAEAGSVVIGLARMNRILELDARSRIARVEAGVVNAELSRRAAPLGLYYAPDPSSQTACTLGGNVAENSGGPHCLKYGVTTRYVTGLTMVRADGDIVELGGVGRSDPLDLTGLVVGSEGCFGIVTEIEVRLLPKPTAVRTLLGVFESPAAAGRAVSAIVARGLLPAALEIIDRNTIAAVEASVFAAGYPTGAGAALVIEFDGIDAGLDDDAAAAAEICREFGAIEVRRAADEEERLALWRGRKKAFGAMGRLAPDLMVQDATVPRSVLPDVLARIDEIATRHRLRVANVFHAGDGNLHPNILFDRRDTEETERVERASTEIMRACVDAGGTITGEHGVGLDKRHYMSLVHGPRELAAMRGVRDVFDPTGVLNPGKVLPDPAPESPAAALPDPPSRAVASTATTDAAPVPSNAIVEYRPEDLTITVSGALSWSDLRRITAQHRQWVPWWGPFDDDASVAEVVSAGGWSVLSERYGGLRDLVLGARVRGAAGAVRLGGRVVKNVAGFDLLRPVIGSGVAPERIEEVTLRLYPAPATVRVLERTVPGRSDEAPASGLPEGLSFLPAAALRTSTRDGTRIRVRLDGSEAEVDACEAELADRSRAKGDGADWTRVDDDVMSALADLGTAAPDRVHVWSSSRQDGAERVAALEALLADEGEMVLRATDLLLGRTLHVVRNPRPDPDRWAALARRFAEAGGELRVTGDPDLGAAVDAARWIGRRTGVPALADAVRHALFGGGG